MKKLLTIFSVIMLMTALPIKSLAWGGASLKSNDTNWDYTDFSTGAMTQISDGYFSYNLDLTSKTGTYDFKFAVQYLGQVSPSSGSNTAISTSNSSSSSPLEAYGNYDVKASFAIDQDASDYYTYTVYLRYDSSKDNGDLRYWDVWIEGVTLKPTVTISPNGGSFITSSEEVTLTSSNGKDVHYTTDGSTPTKDSPSVESGGTINITSSATVKAIASDGNGSTVGLVASADFTITPPANNEAGLYLCGSSFDAVSPTAATKLHYKLKPLPGETNKYYFDLFAASYTMENVQSSTSASGTNITASLDGKAFKLAYIAEDQGSITTYGTNGSPTWRLTGDNSSSTVQKSFSDTKNPWEIINCDGYYRFVVVTNDAGVPQNWYFEIVKGTYVGYKLGSSANGTVDGFYYMTKNNQDAYNNNFFGTCNFKQDEEFYFIVGNQTIKRRYNERETTYIPRI